MTPDEVFIVGGGPSLTGFDFSCLRDVDTIAVNVAALDVPNPTYSITADSGIFRQLQEGKFKQVKTTWVLVTNPDHCSMVWKAGRFVNRNSDYVYNLFAPNMVIRNAGVEGIGFTFSDFRTGYNSGFCALQLAVLLGYKKIYLLGIDLLARSTSHYHNHYHGRRMKGSELDKFYRNFVVALDLLKTTGIKVISCSKTSRLNKHIPFKPLRKILPEAAVRQMPRIPKPRCTPENLKKFAAANDLLIKELSVCENPRLSILICSLESRSDLLHRLLTSLQKQKQDSVEILVDLDNGSRSIGTKRNALVEKAQGDYICCIDDDDTVVDDYVTQILAALGSDPDVCSLRGLYHCPCEQRKNLFIHSIQYQRWFKQGDIYYRCPNHLNAVRRSIALKVKFPEVNSGEDRDYSERMRGLLKKEATIDEVLYHYWAGTA